MSGDRDLGEMLEGHLIDGEAGGDLDPALIRVVAELKADWNAEVTGAVVGALREAPSVTSDRSLGGSRTAPTTTGRTTNFMWRYISIAAVIAVIIIGIKYIPTTTPTSKIYTATPGQRITVALADGSQATLAPATTLRVKDRNVEIDGEALFTVTNHTDVPFTVTTGKSITKVLGTTFSVRAYKGDPEIHVAVAEGRVMVNNSVLANGDLASVNKSGTVSVVHDAERVADMLAFAHGRLVITVQPLVQAAPEIARWYGLNITVDSSAANQHIGITLQGQQVEEALAMIAELTHTRYQVSGRGVTFTR